MSTIAPVLECNEEWKKKKWKIKPRTRSFVHSVYVVWRRWIGHCTFYLLCVKRIYMREKPNAFVPFQFFYLPIFFYLKRYSLACVFPSFSCLVRYALRILCTWTSMAQCKKDWMMRACVCVRVRVSVKGIHMKGKCFARFLSIECEFCEYESDLHSHKIQIRFKC